MASKTTNYGLNKHSPQDFYNVEARNENWDKIDTELKNNVDAVNARVKTAELAAEVKKVAKDGSLTAADLGAEPTGTAANAVSTHNTSASAHSALFAKKQDKLAGAAGKLVGFTAKDTVGPVDAPSGIDAVHSAPSTAAQDSLSVDPNGIAYTGNSSGAAVMQYGAANVTISNAEPSETLPEGHIWMVYE